MGPTCYSFVPQHGRLWVSFVRASCTSVPKVVGLICTTVTWLVCLICYSFSPTVPQVVGFDSLDSLELCTMVLSVMGLICYSFVLHYHQLCIWFVTALYYSTTQDCIALSSNKSNPLANLTQLGTLYVTLQALSSTPTNPHSCFAWSYKAMATIVDCMCSFGWWLEGRGREDSHRACNLFDN